MDAKNDLISEALGDAPQKNGDDAVEDEEEGEETQESAVDVESKENEVDADDEEDEEEEMMIGNEDEDALKEEYGGPEQNGGQTREVTGEVSEKSAGVVSG